MTRAAAAIPATRGATLVAALLCLGACSSVPQSPPTGVDALVVPTPSPDPGDFVARIDNPWLGWSPGASLRYQEVGSTGADGSGEGGTRPTYVEVTVGRAPVVVAGVAATPVTTVAGASTSVDYLAQDRAGNVWWLGREGVWRAGVDGARAGLWMPAGPRTGDGFRQADAPGVETDVATVLQAPAPDDPLPGEREVRLQVTSGLEPGVVTTRTYAVDVGLVREERTGAAGFERTLEGQGS